MASKKGKKGKYAGKRNRYSNRKKYVPINMPQTMLIRMRYHEQEGLNAGVAGAVDYLTYSCNGTYDCNISGTGHQASSFDTWIGTTGGTKPYNAYTVIGSRIVVDFVSTSAIQNNQVGVNVTNASTLPASVTAISEDKTSRSRMLGPVGSNKGIVTIKSAWSARRWFHSKNLMAEEDKAGSYTANPSTQVYYQVWVSGFGTDTDAIIVRPMIEYIVVLHTPNDITAS